MPIGQSKPSMRGLRDERGAALVEFALVVPFLMLIMCATIDFGLAVYTLNNLTAAVREGGRYSATLSPAPTVNDTAVSNRVYNYIVGMSNGLNATQVKAKITNTAPDPTTGNITVKVTGYPYVPVTPLAPLLQLDTIYLNRTAIFRWERSS
jgi:Flp pilus assembly protein TadG